MNREWPLWTAVSLSAGAAARLGARSLGSPCRRRSRRTRRRWRRCGRPPSITMIITVRAAAVRVGSTLRTRCCAHRRPASRVPRARGDEAADEGRQAAARLPRQLCPPAHPPQPVRRRFPASSLTRTAPRPSAPEPSRPLRPTGAGTTPTSSRGSAATSSTTMSTASTTSARRPQRTLSPPPPAPPPPSSAPPPTTALHTPPSPPFLVAAAPTAA